MRHHHVMSAIATAALLAAATAGTATASTPPSDSAAAGGTDCESDTTATATGSVTVTDSFGRTVELEGPATRVAVLEWQQIEDVLSLCVVPVAVADIEGYRTWDTAEVLPDGVTDVGGRGEPSLDALFAAEPDLIIVEAYTAEDEIIGQLESFGVPVLATKGADATDPIQNMLDTFNLIAEVTGRQERAGVVIAEFETSLADAQAAVADADLDTTDFVYFDGWIDGGNVSIRPFGQGSLIGELGEALGLTNAWTGEVDEAYGLGLTDIEGMIAVGDANLFYTGTTDPESEIFEQLSTNPIWESLPAVAEGRAVGFPPGVWTFGGPRSAQQILDAYVEILTG